MKFFLLILIMINTLSARTLNIGLVPYKDPKTLIKLYQPFIKYLEKNSSYKINLHFPKDYKSIIKLIKHNKLDIASVNSYLYVKEHAFFDLKTKYLATSLRNNKGIVTWYYHSYIITKNESHINELKDLKNKSFAFTDINSTSGFLYPKNILFKAGINYKKDLKKYFFLKKHPRVIKALIQNSIDAAGTYDQIVYDAQKKYPGKIKILAKSTPIPLDAFVTTNKINEKEYVELKKLFLNYIYLNGNHYIAGFVDIDKSVFDDIKNIISFSKD